MQFKSNDNNFIFSGNISECNISIGNPYNKDNDNKIKIINPIEKAMNEAEHFIYIISPYVSESNLQSLIKRYQNMNLKLKLLFSYNSNNRNKPTESYLKSFRNFIDKPNFKKFKKDLKEKKIQYDEKREEIQVKKLKIKSYMKFLYFLCFLCPICLGFLYYFNQFSNFTLIPLGVVFVGSIIGIHLFDEKNKKLDLEKNKLDDEEIKAINELKAVPPEIEWKNIEFKILKNKYNSSLDKEPLIHTKLYLMDCPSLTTKLKKEKKIKDNEVAIIAFLGSVNFTYSAFYQNQEFLFETTDQEFAEKLLNYFKKLYDSNDFKTLTKEEIINFLFSAGLITYNDNDVKI